MAGVSGWSWGSAWGDDALDEQDDEAAGRVSSASCSVHAPDIYNFLPQMEPIPKYSFQVLEMFAITHACH